MKSPNLYRVAENQLVVAAAGNNPFDFDILLVQIHENCLTPGQYGNVLKRKRGQVKDCGMEKGSH